MSDRYVEDYWQMKWSGTSQLPSIPDHLVSLSGMNWSRTISHALRPRQSAIAWEILWLVLQTWCFSWCVGHCRQCCWAQGCAKRSGRDRRDIAARWVELGPLVDRGFIHSARHILDGLMKRTQNASKAGRVMALLMQVLAFDSHLEKRARESFTIDPQVALVPEPWIFHFHSGETILQRLERVDTDVALLQHQSPVLRETGLHTSSSTFFAAEKVHAAAWKDLTRDFTCMLVLDVNALELSLFVRVIVVTLRRVASRYVVVALSRMTS